MGVWKNARQFAIPWMGWQVGGRKVVCVSGREATRLTEPGSTDQGKPVGCGDRRKSVLLMLTGCQHE